MPRWINTIFLAAVRQHHISIGRAITLAVAFVAAAAVSPAGPVAAANSGDSSAHVAKAPRAPAHIHVTRDKVHHAAKRPDTPTCTYKRQGSAPGVFVPVDINNGDGDGGATVRFPWQHRTEVRLIGHKMSALHRTKVGGVVQCTMTLQDTGAINDYDTVTLEIDQYSYSSRRFVLSQDATAFSDFGWALSATPNNNVWYTAASPTLSIKITKVTATTFTVHISDGTNATDTQATAVQGTDGYWYFPVEIYLKVGSNTAGKVYATILSDTVNDTVQDYASNDIKVRK